MSSGQSLLLPGNRGAQHQTSSCSETSDCVGGPVDHVSCLQISGDNTMNTGPVSISRAVSLHLLTLLPLYSIQFPWQRVECCWRSSSRISWADFIFYSISLQTKQARKTQEARSVWTANADVMWLWRQDGAVTESTPEAWRVCKNTHLMRVSSCESHMLTFNPELFCLDKQRKMCSQQTESLHVTLFWRVATSFQSEKRKHFEVRSCPGAQWCSEFSLACVNYATDI